MSLPDNIIPFKTTRVDNSGRIYIGTSDINKEVFVRFTDTGETQTYIVGAMGRVNAERKNRGRECDIFILRKEE